MKDPLRELLDEHDAEIKRLNDNYRAVKARHSEELLTLVRHLLDTDTDT